jgi:hypothetical protein
VIRAWSAVQQQNPNRGIADLFGPDLMPAPDVNHLRNRRSALQSLSVGLTRLDWYSELPALGEKPKLLVFLQQEL